MTIGEPIILIFGADTAKQGVLIQFDIEGVTSKIREYLLKQEALDQELQEVVARITGRGLTCLSATDYQGIVRFNKFIEARVDRLDSIKVDLYCAVHRLETFVEELKAERMK